MLADLSLSTNAWISSEARGKGMIPFCVTIDREGASYLPARLPLFYAQITR